MLHCFAQLVCQFDDKDKQKDGIIIPFQIKKCGFVHESISFSCKYVKYHHFMLIFAVSIRKLSDSWKVLLTDITNSRGGNA